MHLEKFVQSETGKYMMSIILGLGLATFFRQACKGRNCLIYRAPPLAEIDDKIYKIDDKCYKFKQESVKCNKGEKIYSFA